MNRRTPWLLGAGALALWAWARSRRTQSEAELPSTVETAEIVGVDVVGAEPPEDLTERLVRARRQLGADPNTLASRQPTLDEQVEIEEALTAARLQGTPFAVDEARLVLARTLPGDALQGVNARIYELLGVDALGDNRATLPLTEETEREVRSLVSRWRPYSADAVERLFTLVDQARELAPGRAA